MKWSYRPSDYEHGDHPPAIERDGWAVLPLARDVDDANAQAIVDHLNLADEAEDADADLAQARARISAARAAVEELDEPIRSRILRALLEGPSNQ